MLLTVMRHAMVMRFARIDLRVDLDGRELQDVVAADDEYGYAVVFNQNSDGSRYRDEEGNVAASLLTGDVRFRGVAVPDSVYVDGALLPWGFREGHRRGTIE